MSYDLMVLDKHKRFTSENEFLKWYNAVTEWAEDIDYNDYRHATPNLQKWFLAMKDIVPPLNGEFAPSDEILGNGKFQEGDYCIAEDCIYVGFAWSDAKKVHPIVADLAKKHDVALFDISSNKVVYPDGFVLNLLDEETSPSFWKKFRAFFHL